jgi:hypothetical protein
MARDSRQLGILHFGEQSGREAVGEHYRFGAAVLRGREQPQRTPVLGSKPGRLAKRRNSQCEKD